MPDVSSGWGRLTYGQAAWNEATTIEQGWGRESWGYQSWGDTPIVTLPSLSASTALGALTAFARKILSPVIRKMLSDFKNN